MTATPTEVAKRYAREAQDRLYDGISFAEEADIAGAAIWGRKDQVLWSRGEPFMLYGPQGVAKTTTAQRLTLGLAGIEPIILGLPVASVERPIFYAACDRPVQAARSWRRMLLLLRDDQREILRERVRFWKGPLPFDIAAEPDPRTRSAPASTARGNCSSPKASNSSTFTIHGRRLPARPTGRALSTMCTARRGSRLVMAPWSRCGAARAIRSSTCPT